MDNFQQTLFQTGKIYRRSEIQKQYGGNPQSGISASATNPYIFIFSGKSGHQHGYKDQWDNPNIFSYTGEGQMGDMRFTKGNLALKDHLRNGKRVFLFIQEMKAFVKFEAELILQDIGFFEGKDREGKDRIAIKFFFRRKGINLDYPTELNTNILSFKEDIPFNTPSITERQGLVTSRVGQGAYRKSILYRWEFKCAVTNYSKNQILIASHILPWKDASDEQRLDVNNGILLSPTYDALFDQHLISFEDNGKIILSDVLLKTNYLDLGISGNERIKSFHADNHFYLNSHRLKFNKIE